MTIKHILCVSDLSLVSKNAEYAAIKLAYVFNAELTVLSCQELHSHIPNDYFEENMITPISSSLNNVDYIKIIEEQKKKTADNFSAIQKELNMNLSKNIYYEIKLENEVTATLDLLEENKTKYDLIVVGKQNDTHWERLLFGSAAKEICDETKTPTLLMPCEEEWKSWSPSGIAVCSTLADTKENVELFGANMANKFSADLTIMHVIDENYQFFANNFTHIFPIDYVPPQSTMQTTEELISQAQEQMNKIIQDLKQATNPDSTHLNLQKIDSHIEVGPIAETVMNYLKSSAKNNLLIIGSRGENALKRFFLGSNTDTLEEACRIPILIVFHSNS